MCLCVNVGVWVADTLTATLKKTCDVLYMCARACVCVCVWKKLQNKLFACVRYSMCTKQIILRRDGREGVMSTAKLREKAYSARWHVQMCRFAIHNVSMTLELYWLWVHSPDAARLVHILYHKQKPTHTCFEAQMSHITSFTTNIVSLLTNARMNPWPVTTGVRWVRLCVFFSVGGLRRIDSSPLSWLAPHTLMCLQALFT